MAVIDYVSMTDKEDGEKFVAHIANGLLGIEIRSKSGELKACWYMEQDEATELINICARYLDSLGGEPELTPPPAQLSIPNWP